jgi:hypothetical protein
MLILRSQDTRSKQPAGGILPAVVAVENPVCPCTGTGWGLSEPPTPASMICHLLAAKEHWMNLTGPRSLQTLQEAAQIAGDNVRFMPVIHQTNKI